MPFAQMCSSCKMLCTSSQQFCCLQMMIRCLVHTNFPQDPFGLSCFTLLLLLFCILLQNILRGLSGQITCIRKNNICEHTEQGLDLKKRWKSSLFAGKIFLCECYDIVRYWSYFKQSFCYIGLLLLLSRKSVYCVKFSQMWKHAHKFTEKVFKSHYVFHNKNSNRVRCVVLPVS